MVITEICGFHVFDYTHLQSFIIISTVSRFQIYFVFLLDRVFVCGILVCAFCSSLKALTIWFYCLSLFTLRLLEMQCLSSCFTVPVLMLLSDITVYSLSTFSRSIFSLKCFSFISVIYLFGRGCFENISSYCNQILGFIIVSKFLSRIFFFKILYDLYVVFSFFGQSAAAKKAYRIVI